MMYRRHVSHVFVLHYVLVVYEYLWVAGEAIAAVVVDVQLFVVVTIVTLGSAPRREGAHGSLGPGVVWVVERDCGHTRPVQVEWVERVPEQFEVRRRRVAPTCNDRDARGVGVSNAIRCYTLLYIISDTHMPT